MESSKSALAQQKKSAIIAAAVQVFAQKGFYNAKVSDVADAAGVAAGTIYLYFKNKALLPSEWVINRYNIL